MSPDPQTCPNCPESSSRLIFVTKEGRRVKECLSCRLQYAEAYPDYETADTKIYSERYFQGSLEKKAERYRNFTGLADEIEKVLGRTGRLLDIGAGEGVLLSIAHERGWQVEGTEIASVMIEHVRSTYGLPVHQGRLEDIVLPDDYFDMVVLNHVLEHVKNPRTTLERIRALLKPGGLVRIEVPNLAGLSARAKNIQSRFRLKSNPWKHYSTGHHFWFFTPATLGYTVERAGLDIEFMDAPAKQWGRLSAVDRLFNRLYRKTLWGGHLVVYAKRKSQP